MLKAILGWTHIFGLDKVFWIFGAQGHNILNAK